MFPSNRGCTSYMYRDPEVEHALDTLVCMAEDINHELLGIAGPCNMPNCPYNRAVNSPFGTTLPGPCTRGGTFQGPSTCGCCLSTRGGTFLPQGTATRRGSVVSPGTVTRGSTLFPGGSTTRGGTLMPRGPETRRGSLFPQGTATRGGNAVPDFMNPRTPGFTNAETRRTGVGGTMTRDWSRADEGMYGRTERGETRRGPMETTRGRGRGRGMGTGRGFY